MDEFQKYLNNFYIGSGYNKVDTIKHLKSIAKSGYNESYDGSMIQVRFDWGFVIVSPTSLEYVKN